MGAWNLITNQDFKNVIAICSFQHNNSQSLNFKIGEKLIVVEETETWYRGFAINDQSKLGIFPKCYVRHYRPQNLVHKDHSVTEIESILREWTSVWFEKYEECEKRKIIHSLMGFFKNLLNLKNVIVGDRSSIDEIKDLKKQTASKILQGNSLLGLDVIAYDSNYNRLDTKEATTIFLYEELKKNNNINKLLNNQPMISMPPDSNPINLKNQFRHQSINSAGNQSTSSATFCLKLSIENLVSSQNNIHLEENSELCLNLFLYKENSADSYFLCENSFFPITKISDSSRSNSFIGSTNPDISSSTFAQKNYTEKCALFCDISEKDFELTNKKNGYRLFLVAYVVRKLKQNLNDRHASISRIFAGGVCDLGANLCNLIYVATAAEHSRHIQSSMTLNVTEYFESSVVTPKNIQEFLNLRDMNESYRTGRSSNSKENFFNLTFGCELVEATYKKACDQFSSLKPCICRKMDFPEIIMPDDFRNDFYVTVIGGEFQKAKNYEFMVNLVQFKNEFGTGMEEIPLDLGDESSPMDTENDLKRRFFFYKSIVYAKQEKPKWNEIVNVSIPHGKRLEEIKTTYLRFLIRNRPLAEDKKDKTKIIGRCYLQITNEDGSAIQDNHSYLPMSRVESENEIISADGLFIRLKTPMSILKHSQLVQPYLNPDKLKDFIEIKVKVVSTQLTQNVTLLNLLSFSTEPKPNAEQYKQLLNYLDELLSVKDEQSAEIVKFLQAILDKLIDILLDLKSEEALSIHTEQIQPCIFDILVAIFQIIENQNKFASFRTVIDAYLSKNFCITLAHGPLLRIFLNLMNKIYDKYSKSMSSLNNKTGHNFPKLTTINLNKSPNEARASVNSHERASIESGCLFDSSKTGDIFDVETALNTIKSIEYIFKFAFRSRELLSQCYRSNQQFSVKDDTFDTNVENIFDKLTQIVTLKVNSADSIQVADLTKIQSFILKYSITLMPILINSKRYSIQRISRFYIGFLKSKFVLQTKFLSKLIKSKLFENPESRCIIIEPLCSTLKNLLTIESHYEEKRQGPIESRLEAVGKIISELMDVLEKKNIGDIKNDINNISKILGSILNTFLYYSIIQPMTEYKQLFASVIISIMRTMNETHFETFFDHSASLLSTPLLESLLSQNSSSNNNCLIEIKINDMLIVLKGINTSDSSAQLVCIKLLYSIKTLIDEVTFPKDWFDLLILRNSVILSALFHVSERINRFHINDFNQLNKQIWFDYFDCMVLLAVDPCLQLENFNENKRKSVKLKYDDIRVKASVQIKKMWFNLGDRKQEFIPNMVDPFMLVALIPIPEIHNTMIPLFFDMINCEYYSKGKSGVYLEFDKYSVPHQLITTLDIQVGLGKGDIQFKQAFNRIFMEKFNAHTHFKKNMSFVRKVVDLFDLLAEFRDIKMDSSDELKTFYLNEILIFYNTMERYDIYVKYVETLRTIHKNSGNQVCAAHTLKLHAQLLNWTNEKVESHLQHSCSTLNIHKDLKEIMFIDIINDFTEGQAWEKALEFSKILRERYDTQFELEKLYGFLRKQADLCENIIKQKRYECNYFLVGFFGKGFPELLQNKQFVFRSEQFEQIITFRPRVESWFPHAQRISNSNPMPEAEKNSNKQYIQVIGVQPVYEPKDKFKDLHISIQILNYYYHNEVNKFKYSYRKESKLNEENPTLWWLIEKTVVISNTLPNVINFYPVTNEITVEISPVQNALNALNERMIKLKNASEHINSLNEVDEGTKSLIQGTVDPGVNGGLPKYKKFMEKEYIEANPELAEKSVELKTSIITTIHLADLLLNLALNYAPNDELLSILETEQLPKLKSIFEITTQATLRKKRSNGVGNNQQKSNASFSIESTPKSNPNYKPNISVTESSQPNKSFLRHIGATESYTGRNIISYLVGEKNNTGSQFHTNSIHSHRDSISSLKSITSENEDTHRNKIFLDETVNPKRPLRPNRNTQNSTSSPSTSNQGSRPISHLSGEDFLMSNSVSMQQINENDISSRIADSFNLMQEEDDLNSDMGSQVMKPPPKPPKPTHIKLKTNFFTSSQTPSPTILSDSSASNNHSSSQSSENLKTSNNSIYEQTKSTVSLNSIQKIKSLASKKLETTSDSVLNRFHEKLHKKH